MATHAAKGRSGCGTLGLCLALAACGDPELTTVPRPDAAVPQRLVGAAGVRDADTLVVGGRVVQLWGVDAPAREAQCTDAGGRTWPCGEHAAAALADWLGARSVNCDPHGRGGSGDRIVALCRLNGRDIGEWLVMHGWAHDAPAQSHGLYLTLERAAASRHRGLHGAAPAPHGGTRR